MLAKVDNSSITCFEFVSNATVELALRSFSYSLPFGSCPGAMESLLLVNQLG